MFDAKDRKNVLQPVVSGKGVDGAVLIHSNATIFLSELDAGKEVSHSLDSGNGAFLYVTTGEISVNGEALQKNDQIRISGGSELKISAKQASSFILVDVEL